MTLPNFSHERPDLPVQNVCDSDPETPAERPNQSAPATDQADVHPAVPLNMTLKQVQTRWQTALSRLALSTEGGRFPRHFGTYLSLAGGAIAVLGLLLLNGNNHALRRSLLAQEQQLAEATATIDELEQQLNANTASLANLYRPQSAYALQGQGKLAHAAGSVVTIADENKAFLVAPELPSLSDGEIYRFWATTDSKGRLMYCGQFTMGQTDFVEWSLPDPACSQPATQALVTIDPITASTASAGEIVLRSRATE